MVYRIYVERSAEYAGEAQSLCRDLRYNLRIDSLTGVRLFHRYDVEGVDTEVFERAKRTIFSEPQTDVIYDELPTPEKESRILAVEYLPGQYDQRADSAAQCIQLLSQGERPTVKTARILYLEGRLTDTAYNAVRKYVINPVECREAGLDAFETLAADYEIPQNVESLTGFLEMNDGELEAFLKEYGLAMDADDIAFCQRYFREEERREPTITEIRLLDSYWSDHCRHTTFLTAIDDVIIHDECIKETFEDYLAKREIVYGTRDKSVTMMDIATMAAKYLKKTGKLSGLDESEEINACSVKIRVNVDGEEQPWLLMFKNETHNHPTEIEPFGGAATCLGGAIRDPLSGRSYVYQAMRVTGAADPRISVRDTIPGKLPQSKITTGAANGYSSYGNQIGLATGGVYEIYHPNYVAKRMEIGAVIAAAPEENVIRKFPEPGDVVILLGGRTGRDGCGGATGSSKAHTKESLSTCGAEVQKGNPPEERKIQRLFRNPEATKLIKRCNDFGAGGVSVAIGELADGLQIDLSRVPKKYEGLDGTELAISESQERMAVVVSPECADSFIRLAEEENLEATEVAVVLSEPRLKMVWNGNTIVDLSRDFLNSNGAEKHTAVIIPPSKTEGLFHNLIEKLPAGDAKTMIFGMLGDLNVCSQKGLSERFDSTIGASTVVMPFGGKYQLTAPQYMAAKIPVLSGETTTASVMAYGFDPYVSEKSPYHGAYYAVLSSLAKLVAAGVSYESCYLTFQEYFAKPQNEPERYGQPAAALLGAFRAQMDFSVASIGGKDSMSGTFERIDVPPTLVSFAVAQADAAALLTPEFKKAGSCVYLLSPHYEKDGLPNREDTLGLFRYIHQQAAKGKILSCYAVGYGGIAEAITKMTFGNHIGFNFDQQMTKQKLFSSYYGAFVVETTETLKGELLGHTKDTPNILIGNETIAIEELVDAWKEPLESVFPTRASDVGEHIVETLSCRKRPQIKPTVRVAKPRVLIPVFPGTNCEYDTKRQFDAAGAEAEILVFRNMNTAALAESIERMAKALSKSQILMLPGGFSGGDEPDGSGKFITAVLRNARIKEAVSDLLDRRDGLILGICNGFQALIKLGLLPYGKIMEEMTPESPTLTFNKIGRHQSMMVRTRISSVHSPWLSLVKEGDIHTVPISHGEGRFTAPEKVLQDLIDNGQIATQYVDLNGDPTMDIRYNPNASVYAIEGILSPDGRVFGKMGHSERIGSYVGKNVPGDKDQKIFASGVAYFQ